MSLISPSLKSYLGFLARARSIQIAGGAAYGAFAAMIATVGSSILQQGITPSSGYELTQSPVEQGAPFPTGIEYEDSNPEGRVENYLGRVRQHNPYKGLKTHHENLEDVYGERLDEILAQKQSYRDAHPEAPLSIENNGKNANKRFNLVLYQAKDDFEKGSPTDGFVYSGLYPNNVYVRIDNRDSDLEQRPSEWDDLLSTEIHEIGHDQQNLNFNMNKKIEEERCEGKISEHILTSKEILEELDNFPTDNFRNKKAFDKVKEHIAYQFRHEEMEVRLMKIGHASFLLREKPISSAQDFLDTMGMMRARFDPEVVEDFCKDHNLSSEEYYKYLSAPNDLYNKNASPSERAKTEEMSAQSQYSREFSKFHNDLDVLLNIDKGDAKLIWTKDVQSAREDFKNWYPLSNSKKLQRHFLEVGSLISPGIAQNDISQHLGQHPRIFHAPTLDFRDFMPGGQTGPDVRTIA